MPVTDDAEARDSASTRKLESREEAGEPEFDSRRGNKPEDEKSYVEEQVGGETLELACLICSRQSFEHDLISTNSCFIVLWSAIIEVNNSILTKKVTRQKKNK